MTPSVRARAATLLAQIIRDGQSLTHLLPDAAAGLAPRDQALLQELCYGVCRFAHRYNLLAESLLRKPFKARDADLQALLLLGIYQLLESRIPDHAALAGTVEVATELKKHWAKGLLNGVLRSVQRGRSALQDDWATHPGFRFSHPQWLLESLKQAWPAHWTAIADANNERPPLTLRLDCATQSRDDYLQALIDAGIGATPTPFSPFGVTLDEPVPVQNIPGFADGRVSVQDEAAQLAAGLLALAPGQRVLDACSAPGGKTCHILQTAPDLSLTALDIDANRLQRVEENLSRLGLEATLRVGDAAQPTGWWDGNLFDRILLDAPCSATGIIRRHPDIKLLRTAADVKRLVVLQEQILGALWPTLAPGGILVYATCSVLPAENSQQIERFLAQTADAVERRLDTDWGVPGKAGRQLLPQPKGHDGFFYAVLQKVTG